MGCSTPWLGLGPVIWLRYERIVLQPELNNAKLQEAFLNAVARPLRRASGLQGLAFRVIRGAYDQSLEGPPLPSLR